MLHLSAFLDAFNMEQLYARLAYTLPKGAQLREDGEYYWPGGDAIVQMWAYSRVGDMWYVGWHTLGTGKCLTVIPYATEPAAKDHWGKKKYFH